MSLLRFAMRNLVGIRKISIVIFLTKGRYVEDAIMKKKKIIAISVVVVLIAAFVVWFEIPRVRIRNYIKENLPEGHYTLYPNYGDFIISDSTRD